ncbi:amino acid permease [Xylariales sp. AK1849]|nr:amino acid permease [Xylariales sp. AK1849]
MADAPPKMAVEKVASLQPSPTMSTVVGATVLGHSHTGLKKAISTRQFVFMAAGGSIGAGLLIASSIALKVGGPGGLLFGFLIVGMAVALTMGSLGELAAAYPSAGSFYDYSVQFISPSWGFAMGWNYIVNFILVVPFEITVMTLVAQYWNVELSSGYLIPIFIVGLLIPALSGAKWYGEAEHTFGVIKVVTLVAFSITATIIAAGGVGADPRHGTGFKYWEGGAYRGGVTGFLWVFVAAGLAYGGTEMLGLSVAECEHPVRVMPLAFKIVCVRIFVCYVLPLLMTGLVIGTDTFKQFKDLPITSPFVLAIRAANIPILPDIFNATILIAVFSMANASVFASSRALRAICDQGMGPKILSRTNERGVPLNALIVVFIFSLIAFVNCAPSGGQIFDWLLALASASNFFTWLSINVCQIRLRLALKKQGKDASEVLPWKSPLGIWGSMIAIAVSSVSLIGLLITAAMPPPGLHDEPVAIIGIKHALGIFVVAAMWLGHMTITWKKNSHPLLIPLAAINLSTNCTILEDSPAAEETKV